MPLALKYTTVKATVRFIRVTEQGHCTSSQFGTISFLPFLTEFQGILGAA